MNKLKFLLLLILFPTIIFAQNAIPLTAKSKTEIVKNISQLLLDNYVFPDTALKMSNYIKDKLKKGAYNKISDPVLFSDVLTNDLHSVYFDRHMLVQYFPPNNSVVSTDTVEKEDPFKRIKEANFGFKKVEILSGNIGYIDIKNLWADTLYGKETVKAALQFVSYTNALIIDIRNCTGGSQETVAMICGYFLKNATNINDMYDRRTNTTTKDWTKPDSSFTKLNNIPLYVLTSNKTFSAAEELCSVLGSLKRATIIGEKTGGGAHGTFSQEAGEGIVISIPYWRPTNPITKSNWEVVGVKPDIETTSDRALETAEMKIFESLLSKTTDPAKLFNLNWDIELLRAINNPVVIDEKTLSEYVGVYGQRVFTLENGKLYYQRTGKPKFEMEPMTLTTMKGKGNTYFKIEFVRNNTGKVEKVNAYYQDNRMETSIRTE